jgi:hypothetical protein
MITFVVIVIVGNHESYRSFDWGLNEELFNKFPDSSVENERVLNHAGRFYFIFV